MIYLSDVKMAMEKRGNGDWFSRKNKRFFGDVSYTVKQGKTSGKPYFVRSTYRWSDMFGSPKVLMYKVNRLNEDNTIGELIDTDFNDYDSVKEWLREA